jgi:hypothetical protein
MKIKILRNEYDVKAGDYIQDNGACLLFCSGDSRTLKQEGFNSYTHLRISQAAFKKLPISKMQTFKSGLVTRYYFTKELLNQ